ncbi:MAG: DUF5411 family protein [Clostridium sp.]|nr:DUF5411 family protein [Clostridium sp.]MCM1443874.1 DUF5411 family protein [Candidatus Amulumruptor caecigallinarius]
MRESFWGVFVITVGVVLIGFIYFFQSITNTDEQNYTLIKEVTENAMLDSFDLAAYRSDGTIKINTEKFVENFVRRFAENAQLSNTYEINIYDVVETPPKVSLEVKSKKGGVVANQNVEFNIINRLDAILELDNRLE